MSKIGNHVVELREMPECKAGFEAYERGDTLVACKAVTASMNPEQSRAFFMGYRDAEIEHHCRD